jgi:hypothetical protein
VHIILSHMHCPPSHICYMRQLVISWLVALLTLATPISLPFSHTCSSSCLFGSMEILSNPRLVVSFVSIFLFFLHNVLLFWMLHHSYCYFRFTMLRHGTHPFGFHLPTISLLIVVPYAKSSNRSFCNTKLCPFSNLGSSSSVT